MSGDAPNSPEEVQESASVSAVSWWHVVGSVLLSLLVFGGIAAATFDVSAFRKTVRHVRPLLLIGAVVLAGARVVFGGWRLRYVSGGRLDFAGGVRGQLAWYFFANVTPTVIGGGPVAPFYIARNEDLALGEAAALTFFCMLLNQLWFVIAIPLLAGAGLFVDLLPAAMGAWGRWALLGGFAALFLWGLVFAYFTLVSPRRLVALADGLLRWPLLRRFRDRGMRELRAYYRRAKRLGRQPPSFYGGGLLLTAGIWLSRYGVAALIVLSLHAAEPVLLFLRSAATMLIGLLVPTPGGSGGLEGLYALFVGPLMPESLMAPTLLLWRLLDSYLFIALGAYLFLDLLQLDSSQRRMNAD